MIHPVAQLIALTCHGNAYLQGARPAQPFLAANSTSRFCDRVVFVRARRAAWLRLREEPVAASPDAWFAALAEAGARGLSLHHAAGNRDSDAATTGFPDSGRWRIVARPANGHSGEQWRSHWEVWNRAAPEQRIWRVTYRGEPVRGLPEPGAGVDAARDALRRALERIEAFAAAEDCRPFTERFREALAALSHPEARHGYHRDLWVEGHLPVSAAGLLDAAQSASVFGGMGSWNDLAFEGDAAQAEYRACSAALHAALDDAICAGANASAL